jgi:5-hydroxyisourate hydrolase
MIPIEIILTTACSRTDSDGRCLTLCLHPEQNLVLKAGGVYKMVFKTKEYFEATGKKCFYPWVEVCVSVLPDR